MEGFGDGVGHTFTGDSEATGGFVSFGGHSFRDGSVVFEGLAWEVFCA